MLPAGSGQGQKAGHLGLAAANSLLSAAPGFIGGRPVSSQHMILQLTSAGLGWREGAAAWPEAQESRVIAGRWPGAGGVCSKQGVGVRSGQELWFSPPAAFLAGPVGAPSSQP